MGRVNRLSPAKVRGEKKPGLYADGGGLWLQVRPGVDGMRRSWVFRYAVGGRERYAGLGPTYTVSLAEAREKARQYRQLRLDGIDPIEHRKAARARQRVDSAKAMTFAECATSYIAAHEAGWRNIKHAQAWQATLAAYAAPVIGALPVKDVDTDCVFRVLEPIWKAKPDTASRLRGRVELILDWAKTRGLRDGENPARWRGHLKHLLPPIRKVRKITHFVALPYAEIGRFMADLRQDDTTAARALEFLILTAARTGEVRFATWAEVDLDGRLWVVPAERTKSGRLHRVPLAERAVAMLKAQAAVKTSDLIFPGRDLHRPFGENTLLKLLSRLGYPNLTVHGLRSSFRDWAAEQTSFPREIAEIALAHAVGDETERAYQRGDLLEKRRKLMDAWAKFCAAPPTDVGGKVVSIGPGRS